MARIFKIISSLSGSWSIPGVFTIISSLSAWLVSLSVLIWFKKLSANLQSSKKFGLPLDFFTFRITRTLVSALQQTGILISSIQLGLRGSSRNDTRKWITDQVEIFYSNTATTLKFTSTAPRFPVYAHSPNLAQQSRHTKPYCFPFSHSSYNNSLSFQNHLDSSLSRNFLGATQLLTLSPTLFSLAHQPINKLGHAPNFSDFRVSTRTLCSIWSHDLLLLTYLQPWLPLKPPT